jgi:hypothetical protein
MTDITPSSQPSRLHTPVTVEIYHHHQPSRYMGFSDTQNAYQWIRDQVRGNNESHLRLFPDVCEKLDYEYSKNGLRGYVVVASVPAVQFCLYYGQLTI